MTTPPEPDPADAWQAAETLIPRPLLTHYCGDCPELPDTY